MELTSEACGVLTPLEMKTLKKESGLTLRDLSQRARISSSQLSEYMNGRNGLTVAQTRACEKVLLDACRSRSQTLSKLLAPEDEMAEAS